MSMPVNFSLTDDQVDELMEAYDVSGLKELKSDLRCDFDDFVEDKINE